MTSQLPAKPPTPEQKLMRGFTQGPTKWGRMGDAPPGRHDLHMCDQRRGIDHAPPLRQLRPRRGHGAGPPLSMGAAWFGVGSAAHSPATLFEFE
jgi:hypothetical protein